MGDCVEVKNYFDRDLNKLTNKLHTLHTASTGPSNLKYIYIYKNTYIFKNIALRVLPITIYYNALTFLLHIFAWPLHLPNIDVTNKLSKNSECK